MDLTEKQISEYDENGWILLPELFSKGEISILEAAAMDVLQRRGPEVAVSYTHLTLPTNREV